MPKQNFPQRFCLHEYRVTRGKVCGSKTGMIVYLVGGGGEEGRGGERGERRDFALARYENVKFALRIMILSTFIGSKGRIR